MLFPKTWLRFVICHVKYTYGVSLSVGGESAKQRRAIVLSERMLYKHACMCCKFADIGAHTLFRIASNSTCMRGFSLATVYVGSASLMQIMRQTLAVSHLATKI